MPDGRPAVLHRYDTFASMFSVLNATQLLPVFSEILADLTGHCQTSHEAPKK